MFVRFVLPSKHRKEQPQRHRHTRKYRQHHVHNPGYPQVVGIRAKISYFWDRQ